MPRRLVSPAALRRPTPVLAAAVLVGCAVFAWGAESASRGAALRDPAGHFDCSYFGSDRDLYVGGGAAAGRAAEEVRSRLTTEVVARLTPPALQARSRSNRPDGLDSIDGFIFRELARRGIAPAPPTTDAEFLRRVTIDLVGRIPSEDEVLAFLADPSPEKRAGVISRLLEDPRWADRWAMFFGDLFRNTRTTEHVDRLVGGRDALHLFLLESLRAEKPYDRTARELITATGDSDGRPWPPVVDGRSPFASREDYWAFLREHPAKASPVSYMVGGYMADGPVQDTYDQLARTVARDFLGVAHVDCVLCHDGRGHLEGISAWGEQATRAQAWGLAAFFKNLRIQRGPYSVPPPPGGGVGIPPAYWSVERVDGASSYDNGVLLGGAYILNTTTGNRPPRSTDGELDVSPEYFFTGGAPAEGELLRDGLARLLAADRQFARAAVNYVWAELFGRGIVEPADQFDLLRLDPDAPPGGDWDIQPSHPELLERLADRFVESGYDLKTLMAEIVSSEAYQLSSRYEGAWNPTYERYFARRQASRMDAEVLYDSMAIALGTVYPLPLVEESARALGEIRFALQLPDVVGTPEPAQAVIGGGLTIEFLDAFLRGDRNLHPRSSEVSILQALQSMNNRATLLQIEISAERGELEELLEMPDDALATALYLRMLGRFPADFELAEAAAHLREGPRRERAKDLAWALLNKVDFLFNY